MPTLPPDELESLWGRVREELAASLPESTFNLWIDPLAPVSAAGSALYLRGPEAVRRWVERRYAAAIAGALRRHSDGLEDVRFLSDAAPTDDSGAAEAAPPPEPEHSFERFVIGPGNRLAHAAALAVAELPGDAYNPLFLHGPPGLGKTHLLAAIAAYLRTHHPALIVHYTTAERFTAEFVTALRREGPDRFKSRYRELDALLIDDVQVLEGKERTQEEVVHTFNTLHAAGKQIVLSSDRPPEALSRLQERLRDRFGWGLCVALEPPDLRTRLALCWRLATDTGAEPPSPEVVREIAARVPGNVRLLEGAVTRVLAFASVLGEPLRPALVDRALPGQSSGAEPAPGAPPSVERIQETACRVLGVSASELLSARRTPHVVRARQLAMYVSRERTSLTLAEIARRFDRDHTTVVHALRSVSQRLEPGSETETALHRIEAALGDCPPPPPAQPSIGPTLPR